MKEAIRFLEKHGEYVDDTYEEYVPIEFAIKALFIGAIEILTKIEHLFKNNKLTQEEINSILNQLKISSE